MSLQTFACPACGSRKALANAQLGEKLHCTCGMSFPASPVFAVADGGENTGGPGIAVAVAVALLVAVGGVAGWMLTRPGSPSPDQGSGPVAVAPNPVEQRPIVPDGGEGQPPPDPSPKPPVPPEKPPEKPMDPPPPPPPPPSKPAVPVASVAAVTLWDAFDLDAPAAAARFTDKLVEVKARGRVARDSIDRPYFGAVVVKPLGRTTPRMSPEQKQWEKDGYPPSVRCYLAPEQAEILEKTPGDQDVVLRGVCIGRKDRDDVYRGYIVELDNCTVVAPK